MSRFHAAEVEPGEAARPKSFPSLPVENRMRLTPLDIQNHRFARSLRGFDPEEVETFLRLVAEDFERVVRGSEEARGQIHELKARLEQFTDREETLRQTLMTAQEVSDDLRRTAAREAEVIIAEAEVKAEKILDAAHRRVAKLTEDIRQMRGLRTRLAAAVRTTIETHLALLEGLSQDPEDDPILDGKVAFLAHAKSLSEEAGTGEADEDAELNPPRRGSS